MKRKHSCVKALIFFLFFLVPLQARETTLYCEDIPPLYTPHASDTLKFGRLWQQIKRLEEKGLLFEMIHERREEIFTIKNHWKEKISSLGEVKFLEDLHIHLSKGTLKASNQGCGAAYFLFDEENIPKYVIKPFDEDILCLNNHKQFASPYSTKAFRVRDHIPLYRSAQAEALSFAAATLLELQHLTPSTYLAIISHDHFFDLSDRLDASENAHLLQKLGPPDREKFCSVQSYIEGIENLYHLVEGWLANNLSEKNILALVDQEDFENLFLLIWILYDTDAHAGNLYATQDENGIYHILKIDNGLTFPEKNCHLLNALYFFPQAKRSLSPQLRETIQHLPIKKIADKILFFELGDALSAFYERVEVLQQIACKKDYSLREIDLRLRALELPQGRELALGDLSLDELENLISSDS
ncbi:MAG: hypothetical protein K1000chlam2_00820 [Chlamydiae bacterium]|nr:hypothetical protein [Chlamydiota bacterium]